MTAQTAQTFTLSDLMDVMVASVGLPAASRTDDPTRTFTDLGLDSLAFLQLQTELSERYGADADAVADAGEHHLGDIVEAVNRTAVSA